MIYDINGNQLGTSDNTILEKIYNNFPLAIASSREVPQNRGALLSYKRALQLKNLPWTALSDVPTYSSRTGCKAGNHTGMIYSSVKEYDKFVGFNVSLKTFMTAVHNPYSLLYTEDTLGTRSKSAYGISYHGVNCGAYFGTVCSAFVFYTLGRPIIISTGEFAAAEKLGIFVKVADQSAAGLKLFDVIWEPGHGNVITDISRDARGNPTTIYWSESVHDYPITNSYTVAQAQSRINSNNAIIYRYVGLYNNLDYEPSPFVAVDGESSQTYQYNDDICTYAGDYASFYEGEMVHINYAKGNYIDMQLYKNDVLIETIPLPATYNGTHSVDVTNYLTGYGKYKARLTDGTNNSDYTYFEVIQTNVSVSTDGDFLTVNFSSANGTPQYVQLTYRNGKPRGRYELSPKEIQEGKCTFDATSLVTGSYDDGLTEKTYVKVFFKGDYGVVRNDFIDSGLV